MTAKLIKTINIAQIQGLLITFCFSLIFLAYACFAENIPDIANYQIHYETLSMHQVEWLYWLLMKLSKDCGLSFFQFRAMCYLLSIILLNMAIGKFVKNKLIVYLLYMLYPFFIDVIQTRNFMAMSLVSYGIVCLADVKNRYRKSAFVTTVVLAAGIQALSYFYLPLFICSKKNRQCSYITLLIIVVFFAFGIVLPFQQIVVSYIGEHINDYRIINLEYKTNYGFYFFIIMTLVHSILLIWGTNLLKFSNLYHTKIYFDFLNVIVISSIILCMFMPLYLYTTLFYRIMRNLLPLSHVVCYLVIKHANFCFDKLAFVLSYILFVIFIGVTQFYIPHGNAFINILRLGGIY